MRVEVSGRACGGGICDLATVRAEQHSVVEDAHLTTRLGSIKAPLRLYEGSIKALER